MKTQKRKFVLFIFKFQAHNIKLNSQVGKAKFLPPNTILKSQLMDRGFIETFKMLYRKESVRKISISSTDNENSISIYSLSYAKYLIKCGET